MKGHLRNDPAWLEAFFQRADEIFVSFSGGEFPLLHHAGFPHNPGCKHHILPVVIYWLA